MSTEQIKRRDLDNITFRFLEDPGHGWLEVPVWASLAVGVKPEEYSPFSYHKPVHDGDNLLYLEEDCDAGFFAAYFEATTGRKLGPQIKHIFEEQSTVRDRLPRLPGIGYVRRF